MSETSIAQPDEKILPELTPLPDVPLSAITPEVAASAITEAEKRQALRDKKWKLNEARTRLVQSMHEFNRLGCQNLGLLCVSAIAATNIEIASIEEALHG